VKRLLALGCLGLVATAAVAQSPADTGVAALKGLRILGARCSEAPRPGDEIVVCGRRRHNERYRIPLRDGGWDPKGPVESVSRARNRLMEGELGGLGSCTNIGPGGMTGCFSKGIERSRQQRGR
jgi:hypothetical protein